MVPPSALSTPLYAIAGGIVTSRLSLGYERDKALFAEDCVRGWATSASTPLQMSILAA
jgi:hypothetical protein